MEAKKVTDAWEHGSPYEQYMGRWSRRVAPQFLSWLNVPDGKRWVDVGCGTGALSAAILDVCSPRRLVCVEPSEGFIPAAAKNLGDRASVLPGNAASLPLSDNESDVVVCALVLNFLPDLPAALAEMMRVTAPGGVVAAYVWDYSERMEITKHLWDTATALDPVAANLHEGSRFPLCHPHALRAAFETAGLVGVRSGALDMTADFTNFDDYWRPFLGGQGPAPSYVMSLSDERRAALRIALQNKLAENPDAPFSLAARAWAICGTVP